MNRMQIATILYGTSGVALLFYGSTLGIRTGFSLGPLLLVAGGALTVFFAGRQLAQDDHERAWGSDRIFWPVVVSSICLIVGVALQFV